MIKYQSSQVSFFLSLFLFCNTYSTALHKDGNVISFAGIAHKSIILDNLKFWTDYGTKWKITTTTPIDSII